MNMKSKLLTALACASCAVTLFGTATDVPVVSDVTFDQPGGGRTVTVTYNLQYAPAIVTMDVLTNGVSIGADKVTYLEGDVNKVVQPGARQFKWFAKRDWPDQLITDNIVSVKLRAWALTEPPPYMVADLETPSNVTYYVSADAIPGGVTNNLYKTSRLAMRRIDAVGVRWNMGAHPTEIGYQKNTPLHVTREKIHSAQLTNDYYIGVYPLTRGQFKRISGFAPSQTDAPSGADDEIYSVQWVAYSEMRQVAPENTTSAPQTNHAYDWPAAPAPESYLGRLSSLTGVAFDLPGEGEWEYACRAGNYSGFWGDGSAILQPSGNDVNLTRLANYHGGSNGTADKCLPVGIYEPNAWGLYDMHGNLWELCLDIYVDDISSLNGAINTTQIADQSIDSSKGIRHTDRGGARHKDAQYCRSSFRDRDPEAGRSGGVGFRLVSRIAQ